MRNIERAARCFHEVRMLKGIYLRDLSGGINREMLCLVSRRVTQS